MSAAAPLQSAKPQSTALLPSAGLLLQRKCSCGGSPGLAGKCEECKKKRLQKKLSIGASNDPLEQEADRVADQVLAAPAHPAVSGTAPRIQRFTGPTTSDAGTAPASVDHVLSGPGRPLDSALQQEMGQRFGHDFSKVRVHTGSTAEQSAREVNAHAYTVGNNVVFGPRQFAPESHVGQKLIAHELTHVVQQSKANRTLQRTPAAPTSGASNQSVPFDRSKVDLSIIADIEAIPTPSGTPNILPQAVTVTFNDPAIVHLLWELYDPADNNLYQGGATPKGGVASLPYVLPPPPNSVNITQGRHTMRCVGLTAAGEPVAYADRTFYVWTSKPTGKPPDIAALEAEKTTLEATSKTGSGKSFGEVGSAFTKLKDVTHDLSVLTTGTGTYVGNRSAVQPAGATPTDCTTIVLEVLENTFVQQGRASDWAKVKKKYAANTKVRGGGGLSGLDVQAALQSEAGWKGIYWAPDPKYQIPEAELDKAKSNEASFTSGIAKSKGSYYQGYAKKSYPGVSISHSVINYAPETPKDPTATASTTTKDLTQLAKLKKLPFGVLAAHGGEHMTVITYGKVIEVHWRKEATDPNLIEQTDLENWAVGPNSGYHYYASGSIVAPAADVDAAFP